MKLFLMLVIFVLMSLTLSIPRHTQRCSDGDSSNIESVSRVAMNTSPCHVTTTEHDVIVDCANKNLDHLKPEWFPLNTTILNLEGNLLDSIPDGIFENCSQLQTLNLNNNKIKTIMPRAFLGLHKLENLDLGKNKLDICDERFSVEAFEQLDNLKVLHLLQNLPFDKGQYCYGFIGNIVSLTSLSIDTRGKHLYFGEEFQNLTKLENLIITGDAEIITDDSFKYLEKLRYLKINTMRSIVNVSTDFLVPLINLDQIFIFNFHIGIQNTLSFLHPLIGRKIITIDLRNIYLPTPWLATERYFKDGILDSNKTGTLVKICVSEFTLRSSHLFYLEVGALTSETWNQCLQNLDLSFNPWQGSIEAVVLLLRMRNLRSVSVTDIAPSYFIEKFPVSHFITAFQDLSFSTRIQFGLQERGKLRASFRQSQENGCVSWLISDSKFLNKEIKINIYNDNTFTVDMQNSPVDSAMIIFRMSNTISFIDIRNMQGSFIMTNQITFMGAGNVEYMDISNSGFHLFTGKLEGFTGLKTFRASGNDMSILSPSFFDTFPALETLTIANCNFDVNFFATQATRLLSSLKRLKSLDMSSNSLSMFFPDIFRTNKNLIELSLSENRFSEIPFSMTNTPNLTRLDIRYNAITSLREHITSQIDVLAHKWGKFELFLYGNILSCACQNIKFLQWLRLTAVTLDRNGNFTCINEQGVLTYTDVYIDLEGFWRQCWGQFFFYVSLIIFSVMTIGFLCAFFINKYRTFIISQLLGIFFGFRQHLPGDYKIGVFFAYEDMDYQFVTSDLKRFVEQRLEMSTYIRHRDLDPGVVLGEAIAEAIASCWRTVIIINQDFQGSSEYFQFTCRSAVSMINLANPFRVLVLVTERYRLKIPRDILSAIQEDNIVVVERLEMDGTMQQILRNRLTR